MLNPLVESGSGYRFDVACAEWWWLCGRRVVVDSSIGYPVFFWRLLLMGSWRRILVVSSKFWQFCYWGSIFWYWFGCGSGRWFCCGIYWFDGWWLLISFWRNDRGMVHRCYWLFCRVPAYLIFGVYRRGWGVWGYVVVRCMGGLSVLEFVWWLFFVLILSCWYLLLGVGSKLMHWNLSGLNSDHAFVKWNKCFSI